ncbi:allatostatin-A receptor-like [Glandiceps talaboti]
MSSINISNGTGENTIPETNIVSYVIPIVYGLTCLVGFVGNTLVIYVVLKVRKMKTTTNLFILNLSIADFLFLLLVVPFTAVGYTVPSWPFGRFICKLTNYLTIVNLYASVFTLMCMSFDRYLAVVYPIRSMKFRNVRNATIVVVAMWCIVIVALCPILTKCTTISYLDANTGKVITYCGFTFTPTEKQAFWGQLFFTSYVLPVVLMSITYFFMLKRLWTGVVPQGANTKENVKQKKKVTKMVVFVVVVFCICWMPIQSVILTDAFHVLKVTPPVQIIIWIGNIMSYANSCINPIIYAFLSDNFRKSFKKVCKCQDGKNVIAFDGTNAANSDPTRGPQTESV